MDKKEIEAKLAELMDIVPECEGLIAANADGKVIIGQTLTGLDDGKIAKLASVVLKDIASLGEQVGKGLIKSTTVEIEEGFMVLVSAKEIILIGLAGIDGQASLSLIKRHLKSIAQL